MSQQNYLTRVTGVTVNPETPPHQHHYENHHSSSAASATTTSSTTTTTASASTAGKVTAQSATSSQQTHYKSNSGEVEDENENDSEQQDQTAKQTTTTTSTAPKRVGPRPPSSTATANAAAADSDSQHLPTVMLRSLVTTKEAGVIIGKGGQNVAEVRDATGVKAGVSKVIPGVHERILTITGTTLGVAKAFSMIANQLLENPVSTQPPAYADCTTIRLLVAHQIMGSIIGKGGAKIREIQEESGAKLVISKDMLPQSTERVIDVFGLIESIKIAVFSIAECLVVDVDRSAGTIPYNPQVRLNTNVNGNSSGPRTGRFDNYDSTVSPTGGNSNYRSDHRHSSNGGYQSSNNGGYQSSTNGGYQSSSNSTNRGRSGSQGNSGATTATAAVASATSELTQTLPVPTDMVGCIIGKGGSFISSIRRHSNARLRISEAIEGATERVVTIVGTSGAIAKALQMIHDQLESEKQRRLDTAEL